VLRVWARGGEEYVIVIVFLRYEKSTATQGGIYHKVQSRNVFCAYGYGFYPEIAY
jgi:hypothetical protein